MNYESFVSQRKHIAAFLLDEMEPLMQSLELAIEENVRSFAFCL